MEFELLKHHQSSKTNMNLTSQFENRQAQGQKYKQSALNNDAKEALSAETLKILCSVNMENLDFKSRFELLFNDITMLKSSAVQGLLAKSNFRFLAWMIFLECIPFDKTRWIETVNSNRKLFENIRDDVCCDPRSSSHKISVESDHPLSQNKASIWNKYFIHNQLKSVIVQDVIRM